MNNIKKIISIIFFAIIYLVVVEIIEANFRTKDDFASGMLYSFSEALYSGGFILVFLTYNPDFHKNILFVLGSILVLTLYSMLWMDALSTMSYEGGFYLCWGILIYVLEFLWMKRLYKGKK